MVGDRAEASVGLSGAVALATAHGSTATVTTDLDRAAAELLAGDAAYVRFRSLLPSKVGADKLPTSRWLPRRAFWTGPNLANWAAALQRAPALTGRSSLSLLAISLKPRALEIRGLPTTTLPTTTVPATTTSSTTTTSSSLPPASSTTTTTTSSTTTTTSTLPTTTTLQVPPAGSVSVLQPTSKVTVVAVVASTGNLPAAGVAVRATLVATGAPPRGGSRTAPAPVERRLGRLDPGAARYVVLPPLAVHRGGTYRLTVEALLGSRPSASDTITLTVHG